MTSRWIPVFVGMTVGALFVYCTSADRLGPDGGSALVADAQAETPGGACCEPSPYTFTKLAEGDFSGPASEVMPLVTEPIDVSAYREVMVYLTWTSYEPRYCSLPLDLQFRLDAGVPFPTSGSPAATARVRVDGNQLRLSYDCSPEVGAPPPVAHYVIAGVK